MQKYQDSVLSANASGDRPVGGASITVTQFPGGGPATIYSDNGVTPIIQPISTGPDGSFAFYAADGHYNISVSGPGIASRTITDVLLQDSAATMALSTAAGTVGSVGPSTVQADLNARPTSAALAAPDGSSKLGFTGGLTNEIASTEQAILRSLAIDVTRFGAVGDGTTDDTVNLRNAINGAGNYATLLLPPGKTYLVAGQLTFLQGQTVMGYGSKIKRIGEKKSTTATSIGTGSSPTAITVADGTQFTVGQTVTVYNGATYDPNAHQITTIVGNVVTVSGNFTVAFASGGTLITCGNLVFSAATNVKVLGLELDGNRANNTSFAKWETHCGIHISGNYSVVRDCYVHDEVSEGIEIGGSGSVVDSNTVVNMGGNGIHFTGTSGAKAINNYVYNVTILGTATGHADGCIIFSTTTGDSVIANNYCDTGLCGIGSIDTDDNSSVVISGNVIKNMTVTAIEGTLPAASIAGKVTIQGNLIYNSQFIDIHSTSGSYSTANAPYNWIVSGNYLENTRILATFSYGVSICNNQIKCTTDTTNALIDFSGSVLCQAQNNTLVGGKYAVVVNSGTVWGKIRGNTCVNQYARGISSASAGTDTEIAGNHVVVESTFTTNGTYYGIVLQNGNFCTGNTLDIQVSAGQHGIYCPAGGVSVTGALVTNNVVRSSGMTSSIRTDGGTQNNFIVANFTVQAISNAGGASNTVSGNFTIN